MRIRRPEIFFSVLCLVLGLSWQIITDGVMNTFGGVDNGRSPADTISDVSFVVVVAIIIYFFIRFYRRQLSTREFDYRILFNTSPLPSWIFDIETDKFMLVNQAMAEKYGYSREELLNMSPTQIRPAEDLPLYLQHYRSGDDNVQDAGVWRHMKRNGEIFYVQIRKKRIRYHEMDCVLVIADDITELIEKEKKIQRLSLVAQHAVNGIIVTGEDNRIEWVNEAFTTMTGYTAEEVIGREPADLLHGPETDAAEAMIMAQKIRNDETYAGEILNYRKDGSNFWVQTTVSTIKVDGNITQHVAIFIDVTQRKQHEQLILQQHHTLRDIAFASSHVVRAPLANILGLTELFDQSTPDNQHEIVEHLRASAKKLDNAVKEMVRQSVAVTHRNTAV